MRRPTVRRQQPGVALFPFLAVLICTMGSLIVLLVLVVQQARATANQPIAEQPPTIDPDELRRLRQQEEDLQWQADQLREQRGRFAEELANRRLALAHLEDHIRRLQDEARRIAAQVEALKQKGKGRLADHDTTRQQLADMLREIADRKKELDDARKELLKRRPAYAIVPYDGPNGTSRRPMYVECTDEGIVIQPEGIVLTAEDFQGPMGPGNPLDASLRAIREHWKRAGLAGEPYPLIVVRPSGAVAFGACRSAMKHWESEFGYELIDDDTELKFPPADPQLALTLQRAVHDARLRQATLAAAMPNRFAEGRLMSFRAEDNVSGDGDGFGGGGSNAGSGSPLRGNGGVGPGTSPGGAPGIGSSARPRGAGSGGTGSGGALPGGAGPGGSGQPGPGPGAAGTPSAGQYAATGSGSPSPNAQPGTFGPRGTSTPGSGGASQPGGAANGTSASGALSPGGGTSSGGSSNAQGTSGPGGVSGSGSQASAGSSGSSGNSDSDPTQSGNPTPSLTFSNAQQQKARSQKRLRGENWGLPNSSPKATAITRPIRVECHTDRLVLLPEKGDRRAPLVLPIEGNVAQNLDAFIDAVWQHMDRWGLAVLGGYWKPILTIDVQPGGEERFAELQQLLRGSGMEVERKP
jgi:hypothetical protein